MKNQYYGDINDYRKYGLIRGLTSFGKSSASVCWMLTPDDPRPDGHRIGYLTDPGIWRHFDPFLFDHLRDCVIERKRRAVRELEDGGILPNCTFYSEVVTDDASQRKHYLARFLDFAKGSDLVFFDPDNGVEVNSVKIGRKNSSKYLYLREVCDTFSAGHSVLVYQHLPPKPREVLASRLVGQLREATGSHEVYLYWTQFVVFSLVPSPPQKERLLRNSRLLASTWNKQIIFDPR